MVMAIAALLGVAVDAAHAGTGASLASKPPDPTRSTVARFSFLDAHIGVTLVCSLDGSGYEACSSPTTYRGLATGEHTFSVKTKNSVGRTIASMSYSWTIDRKAPSIKITSPRTGRIYGRRRWSTGCERRRVGVCGTATNSRELASVRVSLKRNATGRYWNGRRFNARKAVYLRARLSRRRRGGSAIRRGWFYAIGVPSRDGKYTLRVRAKDKFGNTARPRERANSHFTIDTRPPTSVITSRPSNPSTSRGARFTFRAKEQGVRFRCHLNRGPALACGSPISYHNLGLGVHTFTVAAVDAAGNTSISRYSWRIVSSLPLQLSGEVATSSAMLYPGQGALAIPVTVSNPNTVTVYVTELTTSLQSTGAPGCSVNWFRVSQVSIPPGGIVVAPRGSVTLPAQGAAAPTIQLTESGTNQDACQNARLTLAYSGVAHG